MPTHRQNTSFRIASEVTAAKEIPDAGQTRAADGKAL
jgi:hypothetical protein